ncbi:hypothetical protein DPMN_192441 [Dreissena polymorpha]|uniref:Uncharacterized protein n=1 Tax=Dreissena polymorpha TaxID=45954 RepID=A0A9D3Y4U5_DREPO|nr:hypothetical protein DPMN_192441 [Dreissena polymorpha]
MLSAKRSGLYTRFSPMRPGFNHPSRKKVSLIGGHNTGHVGFPPFSSWYSGTSPKH